MTRALSLAQVHPFDHVPMASTNGSGTYGTPQRDVSNGTPPIQTPASGPPSDYQPVTNGRKRKADGTSSRGVANLTPEQLAKKRANDREAQRAIRERTRNQIETLERRIKELESQQPFQELQNALRQREQVQAENDDLKRRMQSIFALLQPIASAQGLNDLAAATAQQSPLPLPMPPPPQAHMYHQQQQPPHPPPPPPPPHQPFDPQAAAFAQHHLHPDLRNTQPPRTQQSPATAARYAAAAAAAAAQAAVAQNLAPRWSPHQQYQQTLASQPQTEAERHGLNYLVEERKPPQQRELLPAPPPSQQSEPPLSTRLPLNTEATCDLDTLLLDFQAERRRAAVQGTSSVSLIGPAYPSISSLLNPQRASKVHPMSKFFADVLGNFPAVNQVPEQVAALYIMFLNMRWRVSPTDENYNRMPDWIRPVRAQVEMAHPAWFDNVPWPSMRDRMVRNPSAYPHDRFSPLYTTTFSLNWPYDPQQCLLPKQRPPPGPEGTPTAVLDDDEEFMINPVFESHLRNLSNWSIGPDFANAFPDLIDGIRIKPN